MRRRLIIGALSIILLALLINFMTEVVLYDPTSGIYSTKKPIQMRTSLTTAYKPAWGKGIVKRNLFSPRRGKIPAPVSKPVTIQHKKPAIVQNPDVTLKGVVLNQFGVYKAYIQRGEGKPAALKEGDTLDNLRIIGVQDRTIDGLWNNNGINLEMKHIKSSEN